MKRKKDLCLTILLFSFTVLFVFISQPSWAKRGGLGGRGDGPVIYVTSQGLYFDSIVTADPLPHNGFFQKLEMDGPTGLQTEFGPGDPGYIGGRWWIDLNDNDVMDEADKYFLCPLLGPGRISMW